MRSLAFIIVALGLALASCTDRTPMTEAHKSELRHLLSPKFTLTSVPSDRTEDFYLILDAFAAKHRDEEITAVTFESASRANISFFWSGGFHGGGATATKHGKKWTVGEFFRAL